MGYNLRDNLPPNAHFWQVGLLDILLSENPGKSHNFIFMTSHFSTLFSKYKSPGGLYLERRFNGGFFALPVWGLIFGGAYTWTGLFSEFYGMFSCLHQ